tara:strand:- start:923 stop:1774 length:852 start_codon:yes stop_codon:yes gene_type:complete
MYQNFKRLKHLDNFIEDGGLRIKIKNEKLEDSSNKISVITVVKNSSFNIEKTINSVLSQSNKNFEYIIIDGDSTDDTKNKIRKYDNKIDYWCSIKDKGIYDAMNYGLMLTTGEIITIINSGDIFTHDALNIVSKYFSKNKNLDYLFGTVKRHYLGNNFIIKTGYNTKRIKYNFDSQTCHSSGFFIKKSLQKKIGLYNLNFKCSSDYDLFYKILTNDNYIGNSTINNEITGIVESGGFSSKYGFWNRIIEEAKIRIHNKQNIFLILIIFLNAIIKNYSKKFFKN